MCFNFPLFSSQIRKMAPLPDPIQTSPDSTSQETDNIETKSSQVPAEDSSGER